MPPDEHNLGPLEARVLGLLVSDRALAVQDVQAALADEGHALAYTTVMTVLARLHEKGLVAREREGRRYLYRAGTRAPTVSRGLVATLKRALFPNDPRGPLLALLDDDALSEADLRALRAKIDARLRDKKESS
jgi:predicted transcriptional regulator